MDTIAKIAASTQLGQVNNRVESRARGMERAILQWLQRYAAFWSRREMEAQLGGAVVKSSDAELQRQLRDILLTFGLRQANDAAFRSRAQAARSFSLPPQVQRALGNRDLAPAQIMAMLPSWLTPEQRAVILRVLSQEPRLSSARALDAIKVELARPQIGTVVLPATVISEYARQKDILIQGIASEARTAVRESVRREILTALSETPRPSAGELARRIRFKLHGTGSARTQRMIDEEGRGILPTTRLEGRDGLLYHFGPERAALIARTELVQAENTGIFAGYGTAGVRHVMWLSYRDGRSGDRHHEEMHGEIKPIGEPFETPLGNTLRYPGDPLGPIKETANCRCTLRAVRGLED